MNLCLERPNDWPRFRAGRTDDRHAPPSPFARSWILLALVFLFEAWLWDQLAPIVALVVACFRWRGSRPRIAACDRGPARRPRRWSSSSCRCCCCCRSNFSALWMLAHGYWLGALGVLALAKVVGLGVTAFIFDITRPKLLQMAWFQRFYDWVMRGIAWAHALTDPIKIRIKLVMRRIKRWLRMFAPKRAGRTFKLLLRIRRRMQARAPRL